MLDSHKTFLLKNNIDIYYILNGDYIQDNINSDKIKEIFFSNKNDNNENYKKLKKYKQIQIYFFTCVKISL